MSAKSLSELKRFRFHERTRRIARAAFAPRLIIMAKSPRAGRVKRRLARSIGDTAATSFARTCLAHILLRLGGDTRWRTLLAIAPDTDLTAALWSRAARPGRIGRLPQGSGDLGTRMQRLFQALPPGPAIIVGSDIPAIGPREIANAFRLLGNADTVFGPAADGGYWLVGLRRSPRLLAPFARVRWSSPHALANTLANLEGRRVAFAAMLSDVDSEHAYRQLRGQWQRLIPSRSGR
ncbi:MAG: TIGR04282 family arsenosugar biosynthesis glycosyltransferase [Methyloceanibacter sp.]